MSNVAKEMSVDTLIGLSIIAIFGSVSIMFVVWDTHPVLIRIIILGFIFYGVAVYIDKKMGKDK